MPADNNMSSFKFVLLSLGKFSEEHLLPSARQSLQCLLKLLLPKVRNLLIGTKIASISIYADNVDELTYGLHETGNEDDKV